MVVNVMGVMWLVGVNVPFQHKYGYIRDEKDVT